MQIVSRTCREHTAALEQARVETFRPIHRELLQALAVAERASTVLSRFWFEARHIAAGEEPSLHSVQERSTASETLSDARSTILSLVPSIQAFGGLSLAAHLEQFVHSTLPGPTWSEETEAVLEAFRARRAGEQPPPRTEAYRESAVRYGENLKQWSRQVVGGVEALQKESLDLAKIQTQP